MAEEDQMVELPHDEQVWNEEMEKTESSPMGMAKKIFILAKSGFVLYQTVKAALAWRKSKKKMGTAAMLLLLQSALIVAGVCAYKFTSK